MKRGVMHVFLDSASVCPTLWPNQGGEWCPATCRHLMLLFAVMQSAKNLRRLELMSHPKMPLMPSQNATIWDSSVPRVTRLDQRRLEHVWCLPSWPWTHLKHSGQWAVNHSLHSAKRSFQPCYLSDQMWFEVSEVKLLALALCVCVKVT